MSFWGWQRLFARTSEVIKLEKGRWDVAQFHEKKFWEKFKKSRVDKEYRATINDYWAMHYKKLMNYVSVGREAVCLEIGSGPTPFLDFFPECTKFALDPLMDYYISTFSMPEKIRYIKGIGENLPFQDNYFDILLAINTLDHVHSPKKFIDETIRCLKKGGVLYIVVDCYPSLIKYYKSFKEAVKIGNSKLHPNSFTVKDIVRLIGESEAKISHTSVGIGTLGDYVSLAKPKKDKSGRKGGRINNLIDIFQKKGCIKFADVMVNKILLKVEKMFSDNAVNSDFIFIVSKL